MTSHNRSVKERVRSGFVFVGELVGGFLIFVLAATGLVGLIRESSAGRPRAYLLSSILLIIATGIMFATAERWAGFIPGFLFLSGFLRGVGSTILPPHDVSRAQAVVVTIYCIVVIAMLWRFIPPRRLRATILDRAALTAFALSVAAYPALAQSSTVSIAVLLIGCGPLLIAWAAYRQRRSSGGAAQQPAAAVGGRQVRG